MAPKQLTPKQVLCMAILEGNDEKALEIASAYIKKYCSVTDKIFVNQPVSLEKDNSTYTLLHLAIIHKLPKVAKFLIDMDSNLKAKTKGGGEELTPLHCAILSLAGELPSDERKSMEEVVTYMLEKNYLLENENSILSETDHLGRTPIQLATLSANQISVLDRMLASYPPTFDFNQIQDNNCNTLLHLAAQSNNLAATKLLISHGINPYLRNIQEQLPQDLTTSDEIREYLRLEAASSLKTMEAYLSTTHSPSPDIPHGSTQLFERGLAFTRFNKGMTHHELMELGGDNSAAIFIALKVVKLERRRRMSGNP